MLLCTQTKVKQGFVGTAVLRVPELDSFPATQNLKTNTVIPA